MAWTEVELRRRAHRAYELGRLRRSIRAAWPVAPLATLAMLKCCGSLAPPLLLGGALAGALVACAHRGGGWKRAIGPGLYAGVVPFTLSLASPALARLLGDSCAAACRLLVGLCLVGGLVAGGLLACAGDRQRTSVAAALVIATLTGALGCIDLGLGALVGLGAGLATGAAPAFLRRRSS